MEQHPVPQNVTTFQFRLIGDMTIKQFGYLAAGVVLAYVSTKLPLPFFFTWPMALFFGFGGFGLAFVPVEERPMDIWITSFLRNTYSPTQYVWQKTKPKPAASPHVGLQAQPQQPPVTPAAPAAKPSMVFPSILSRLYGGKPSLPPTPSLSVSVQQLPDPFGWIRSRLRKGTATMRASFANPFGSLAVHPNLQKPRVHPAAPFRPEPPKPPQPPQPQEAAPRPPEAQVAQTETRQKQLAEELARIHRETPAASAVAIAPPQPITQPTVRAIGVDAAVAAGLPKLTTFPNVVTGIIKDDRGNFLAGALVTVRDNTGVPLRALKTNKLGQFAASTPLSNGTYLVEIEDPQGRYVFDRAQITASGSVLLALEIRAKTQKQIYREKLEKAIFGAQP